MVLMQCFMELPPEVFPNPRAYHMLNILHAVLPLAVALLFLFLSEPIANCLVKQRDQQPDAGTTEPVFATLWFWITIIGVYFFASSAPAVIGFIIENAGDFAKQPSGHVTMKHIGRGFWSHCFTLLFSLILILKSKSVERHIQRRTKRSTQ